MFESVLQTPASSFLPPRPHSEAADSGTVSGSGLPDPNRHFNGVWNSHSDIENPVLSAGALSLPCCSLSPSCGRPARWCRAARRGAVSPEIFLEALTERMGLHYTNEATGMAATLPSFMPSQPAPFCWEFAPYPVIAYSVFFYFPSFLFSALIPVALALKCTSSAHICVHAPGRHISQEKPACQRETDADNGLSENKDLLVWWTGILNCSSQRVFKKKKTESRLICILSVMNRAGHLFQAVSL